jgi:pyruvate dehydrogenase E2 component (dihydrolipoamide acetyltransferase)
VPAADRTWTVVGAVVVLGGGALAAPLVDGALARSVVEIGDGVTVGPAGRETEQTPVGLTAPPAPGDPDAGVGLLPAAPPPAGPPPPPAPATAAPPPAPVPPPPPARVTTVSADSPDVASAASADSAD